MENGNNHRVYEDIEAEGHLIDSNILSRMMSGIVELDGEYEVLSFQIGRGNENPSTMTMRVFGRDGSHLTEMLRMLHGLGVVPAHPGNVSVEPAPADGVFPEGFYSTTNLETQVRIDGAWYPVWGTEMDLGICVDTEAHRAWGVPISQVRKGDAIAVGQVGIRVMSQERLREKEEFEFMNSTASSEKPKGQIIRQAAALLREVRESNQAIIAVVGPAVVHTGAAEHLKRLVRAGYINVLFGGNAVATHDIESALYGTSLGIDMATGVSVPGGHEHHLRAINRIRACGGIRQAVEQGVLTDGLMHSLVETNTPYILAGSIRDDGPLPDVITDTMKAQEAMRPWCQKAGACLMMSTMLHSIATGNLLPAAVTTVCVDINPAVVTKLSDRGSFQTIGIITDVGLFLKLLADELNC
ncbi:TIGR00300 family protein [Adlercreutzia sp. ZJ154]|uniref:ornithine cyclodeaminase n=1 Tax=Adlercreutzia sp. ZJ154 TaxID=2709790 RepID=UPI0013EC9CC0|nr:TIGR00300 family protein [Adlercreutzia sp. ZJ154]